MAQLIVRELDHGIVQELKARAKRRGRSLEAELREILARGAAGPCRGEKARAAHAPEARRARSLR